MRKEEVSLLIPDRFQERWLRIYVRDPEKLHVAQVLKAVKNLKAFDVNPFSLKMVFKKSSVGVDQPILAFLFFGDFCLKHDE